VAIFENGIVQVNSSVGTISSLIWQPSNTSTTTYGAFGSVTVGAVLKDVTIVNTGSNVIYVGSGSASAAATTGLQIPAGAQLTIQGYNVTASAGTTGNIWAQTATVGQTSSTVTGLASVASVV
jgi:hypothetical protein